MSDEDTKGGSGQHDANSESDDAQSQQDDAQSQQSDDTQQNKDDAGKKPPFDDLDKANEAYGNLFGTLQQTRQQTKELEKKLETGAEDKGESLTAEEVRNIVAEEAQKYSPAGQNNRTMEMMQIFMQNPSDQKDVELLTLLQTKLESDPNANVQTVYGAAKYELSQQRQRQEAQERKQKNDTAKGGARTQSTGATQKNYDSGDEAPTADEVRKMTPEQRDAYARSRQFDE